MGILSNLSAQIGTIALPEPCLNRDDLNSLFCDFFCRRLLNILLRLALEKFLESFDVTLSVIFFRILEVLEPEDLKRVAWNGFEFGIIDISFCFIKNKIKINSMNWKALCGVADF